MNKIRYYLHLVAGVKKLHDKLLSPSKAWEYILSIFILTFLLLADGDMIPNDILLITLKMICFIWLAMRIIAIPMLQLHETFGLTPKSEQINNQANKEGDIYNATDTPPNPILESVNDAINEQEGCYAKYCPLPPVIPFRIFHISSISKTVNRIIERLTTKCK